MATIPPAAPSEPSPHTGRTAATQSSSKQTRVLAATSVGTALEWFDFSLYGVLAAVVFPQVFFPESSPTIGAIQSFATFGVGFLARPLGAIYFARIADRVGRKKAMVQSLTLMGIASLALACLPGYASIGVAAPAILVLLRFLQGFCLGGEASSAQIMALEYAPDQRRGFYGSMVNFGNPLGLVMVLGLLLGAGAFLSQDAIDSWGWRVLFGLGALIAVVGYFIRRKVDESPAFREAQAIGAETKTPLREVFRTNSRTVISLVLVWLPNTFLIFVVTTYGLSYLTKQLGFSSTTAYTLQLLLSLCGLVLVPLGGIASDRFGRRKTLFFTMGAAAAGTFVFFPLLDTKSPVLALLGMLIAQGPTYMSAGVMAAFFAEPFPTMIRYSGHASVYTLNNLIAGSSAPFVAAILLESTGTSWSIVAVVVILFTIALIALYTVPETRWQSFKHNHETSQGNELESSLSMTAVGDIRGPRSDR